jgi:hypothetical protein
MKSLSPLSTASRPKGNLCSLKSTGLNLIPEEDEEKIKTLYGSSKKFFDNTGVENVLRMSRQCDFMALEKKDIPLPKGNKLGRLKLSRTIRLNSNLTTTETSVTPKKEITNLSKTIDRGIKKSEKCDIEVNKDAKPLSSKTTVTDHSPLRNFFEEESTKHSNKPTPDRVTPTSIRTERSNSRKHATPPDSAKLPTIRTTRTNKDYDLNNIIDVANDFKEDPLIKRKLNDIYQNIADIKKVLDQRSKNRVKISSAPVGTEEANDFRLTNKFVKNKLAYNNMKLKLNGNIVKATDRIPIKIVKK